MIRLSANPTEDEKTQAYAAGLLRKEQLKHGVYYRGRCRNAKIARWHAGAQKFVHWRVKFGSRFLECIKHPEDERNYDVFLAQFEETDPGAESIPDEKFDAAVQ